MTTLESLLEELALQQFSSPDRVIELATMAARLAREQGDRPALVRALTSLSYGEQVQGAYQIAFDHILEALGTSRMISDVALRLTAMLRMASLLSDLDADNVALLVLSAIERSWKEGLDKAILMRCYISMSTSYLRKELPELALPKLGQALQIASDAGDERSIYWCIHSIGIAHAKRGEYQAAIERYESVLPYYTNGGQLYNQAAIEMLLGAAYMHVNRAQAKYYLDLALSRGQEHQFDLLTAQTSITLSKYYRGEGDLDAASKILHEAEARVTSDQHTKTRRLIFNALSSFYEDTGNYQQALVYLKAQAASDAEVILV